MARQERNNVDYFPHTVSHGKKMFYLRSKYKNDGYTVWFMLLEQLARAEYHYLNLSNEVELMYLSCEFMVAEETLTDIINILVKFGDFDADLWNNYRILFNEKFVESVSDAYKKRNNDCISKSNLYKLLGIPYRLKGTPNELLGSLEVSGSTQRIEDDRIEEKRREDDDKKTPKSAPPFFTISDLENQIKIDQDDSGFTMHAYRSTGRSIEDLKTLLAGFIIEQKALNKVAWKNESDAKQHFINWAKKQPIPQKSRFVM